MYPYAPLFVMLLALSVALASLPALDARPPSGSVAANPSPPRLTRRLDALAALHTDTRTQLPDALARDRTTRRAWSEGAAQLPPVVFARVVRAVGADARRTAAAAAHELAAWHADNPRPLRGRHRYASYRHFRGTHDRHAADRAALHARVAAGELAALARLRDVLLRWAGRPPAGALAWADLAAWTAESSVPSARPTPPPQQHRTEGPGVAPTAEARAVALREARMVEWECLARLGALKRHYDRTDG